MAVENPDGSRSTAQSARNAGGQVHTLIEDEDGRRVVGPDGDSIAIDEDHVPVSADNRFGTRDLQYDADEGVWRRFVLQPVGEPPTPLSYWDPYRGQWMEPTQEMIDRGIMKGHIVVDKDGGLQMTDGWRSFIAGVVIDGAGQAIAKPLEGAARASGDMAALRIVGRFGKALGPLGAVPGVVIDLQNGRLVPYAVAKGAARVAGAAGGTVLGTAAMGAPTGAAAVTAPVWLLVGGGVAGAAVVAYGATWLFGKIVD
ncbi:hypothetical protein [Tomitella gaofuii]|uniref:hypothetical protein n=1 Tax=Tomitella gaofuii TaxID=2760083 RepID=UPI0015FDB03D|nr:hypothetical protein [Tomitella gaofuii]